MTKNSGHILLALALGAAVSSVPAVAQDALPSAGNEPVYEQRVGFADLDLSQVRDQRTLKSRVRIAARKVCSKAGDIRNHGLSMEGSCVGDILRETKPQLIAAIDDARSGRQQLASSLVISSRASAR